MTSLILFAGVAVLTYFKAFAVTYTVLLDWSDLFDRTFRLYSGQWPYRDCFCPTTPLTYYVQAFLWKIFGVSVIPMKAWMATMNGILCAACWAFLKQMGVKKGSRIFLLVLCFVVSPYTIFPIPWYDLDANAFALLSGMCLAMGLKDARKCWFFGAGCLMGITYLFKQNTGMACVVISAVLLTLFKTDRDRWKSLGLYAAGIVLLVAPMFGMFYFKGILPAFWEWTVVRAAEGKVHQGLWLFLLGPFLRVFGPIHHFLRLWFALYLATFVWVGIRARPTAAIADVLKPLRFLVAFSFLTTYANLLSNSGGNFHMHMISLWVPLSVWALAIPGGLLPLGLFAVVILGFIFQIFRVTFLRKHFIDPDAPDMAYAFQTSRLKGAHFSTQLGPSVDAVIGFLQEKMKPEENLFIYPKPLIAYYALQKLSPVPVVTYLDPPAMRVSDQATVLQNLSGKSVRWAVLGLDLENTGPSLLLFTDLNHYIAEHFEIVRRFGPYIVLYRPDDAFRASPQSTQTIRQEIQDALKKELSH